MTRLARLLALLLLIASPAAAQPPEAEPTAAPAQGSLPFRLTLDPAAHQGSYTGRVYLVFSKSSRREPRREINNWFSPPQVIAQDVRALAPGKPFAFDASVLGFPKSPAQIPAGKYTVQAIARRGLDHPVPGQGPDDLYSEPVAINFPPTSGTMIDLTLGKVVEPRPFVETDHVKLVEMRSPSLSLFHRRDVMIRAGVVLPLDWTNDPADARPVIYFITGFGGDHHGAQRFGLMFSLPPDAPPGAKAPIVVVPDPTCYRGHSVFADSDNNGPWGRALVEELIPEIDRRYHTAGAARRYVTGISSGGWSCLWLQVRYPDAFAGCWSHCPDPVDFRDFQRIDLYAPGANMYTDEHGARRPLARGGPDGKTPMMWYDDFCRMERVLGPGGQIGSFEAVFSRRGEDGEPESLFNRDTGNVNTQIARTWERYDIRLILEREWPTLGPRLKGKLHIYAGELDTFYLDGAAELLKASLEKLGSDAVVEIVSGMPHTIHRPGVESMMREIAGSAQPGGG